MLWLNEPPKVKFCGQESKATFSYALIEVVAEGLLLQARGQGDIHHTLIEVGAEGQTMHARGQGDLLK